MRLPRRKPPVLAELSGGRPDGRVALRGADLEAYNGLLGKLNGQRTLLTTGMRDDGKEVAMGLAATAAAAGRRTALLECDLLEPGLADAVGLARAPGLYEYLRGKATAEQVLSPVALAGPGSAEAREPLVCVVAGRPSIDGPRLLASDAFLRALRGLRAAYELVVVSGPPLRDELSLRAVLPLADASLGCLGATDSRSLPVSVSGLVIRR